MILLAICQAPDLLLLDEPAAGLDVASRRELLGLLSDYLAGGTRSLVFSTHIVTDVERIASHVAILDDGCLVECSELERLQDDVKSVSMPVEVFETNGTSLSAVDVLSSDVSGNVRTLVVRGFAARRDRIRAELASDRVYVDDLPLEEIFLALTRSRHAE